MALAAVSLDDKYKQQQGIVLLTGIQALTRLPLMQAQLDKQHGLNTAGFISGYRGSPLGSFDKALWEAKDHLAEHKIEFIPGINEDLGATAVWGSQQPQLFPDARYQGVFGLWYGKGPGVDRTGDVFKHANAAGSSQYGGVLAVAGDDHACKSSTLPHQSDYAFIDAMMPVLYPANAQEIIEYGLYGWALSRYSGCWVGFKCLGEVMDSSMRVDIGLNNFQIMLPTDFTLPAGGLNIRWPDPPPEQESRLHQFKLPAAQAFVRANQLDRPIWRTSTSKIGIITAGKSYLDVIQALSDLGITESIAKQIGLTIYKAAVVWPLEPMQIKQFASGLNKLIIIEEKRPLLENQIKQLLYELPDKARPTIIGKANPEQPPLLPSTLELSVSQITQVLAQQLLTDISSPLLRQSLNIEQQLKQLNEKQQALAEPKQRLSRTPHFCSGCPHNSSTKVPEGSRAMAGIGCHYMVTWMDRNTDTFTQMGGEGVTWIGQAPFSNTKHVFQNLGDGTYFHSGILAIRACVAAKVNITFKILYNDAVAMTGGQSVDGQLSIQQITQQVYAEGVRKVVVVSDNPNQINIQQGFAPNATLHHRDELDELQKQLREYAGTSVLIYQQTCAAEKRRRRKRKEFIDPPHRLMINPEVCEGCGDCSEQSNCLSIVPKETVFGRKRMIDQSACNKDYTCSKGFCPSFVSIIGGRIRQKKADLQPDLPNSQPKLPSSKVPYNILITGVGGTGVVTISAILAMAAHIAGKGVTTLDQTGLAQKFGAVTSHVRIADEQQSLATARIPTNSVNLLLACDLMVANSDDALDKLSATLTHAVVNTQQSMPGTFARNPDLAFPNQAMLATLAQYTQQHFTVAAQQLATALLGDAIATNLFMIGYAWQQGLIPLPERAIMRAIELNGVAVSFNQAAFIWGRKAAENLTAVEQQVSSAPQQAIKKTNEKSLDDIINQYTTLLTAYQNAAYANRYQQLIKKVAAKEHKKCQGQEQLAKAVAENYGKLLAYKDEYEVARLYSDNYFWELINQQFEGSYKVAFHLAPPLLSKRNPATGLPEKRQFGPWLKPIMKGLAKLKWLRNTPFDPFGYSADRKLEKMLISNYEEDIELILEKLNLFNYDIAIQIAKLPSKIKGFGHIKEKSYQQVHQEFEELLKHFRSRTQASPVKFITVQP
ncbi:indolepyruvate ferredoxin oxidoreductase family protein [Spartinivicinus poritis]|uniref:Indolepyruvate ferredoxin oxidoreductase family protein n=1 Tax=Spartinivicinus poritis TaxID=2994640 RepID=A0ABT5UHI2_9GAMM|nr:indolepyruvate ferredoxin oxidoreductase family protein [Spartinivicinus sp. A2-2]MDE1465451.1 indolepyruvate ferredoxin oxidoreductase family protein [Spartinivicinus sp. A2-2]